MRPQFGHSTDSWRKKRANLHVGNSGFTRNVGVCGKPDCGRDLFSVRLAAGEVGDYVLLRSRYPIPCADNFYSQCYHILPRRVSPQAVVNDVACASSPLGESDRLCNTTNERFSKRKLEITTYKYSHSSFVGNISGVSWMHHKQLSQTVL